MKRKQNLTLKDEYQNKKLHSSLERHCRESSFSTVRLNVYSLIKTPIFQSKCTWLLKYGVKLFHWHNSGTWSIMVNGYLLHFSYIFFHFLVISEDFQKILLRCFLRVSPHWMIFFSLSDNEPMKRDLAKKRSTVGKNICKKSRPHLTSSKWLG